MSRERLLKIGLFLLPIAAILFIFRNVIFFGGIYANQDVIYNYIPYYLSLIKGAFVEYAVLGGFPVYMTMQATWFSPFTKFLLWAFEPVNAYIVANITFVLLSYIFSYLFARKLKLSHEVSIISSTVYIFSGQVMLWSHTPLIALYHFTLPAVLYLFEVFKNSTRISFKILLLVVMGVLLGYGWIGGHVQFNVYVHTFFFIYAFFTFFVWGDRNRKNVLIFLSSIVFIFAISFCFGLPQIDAVLATQPLTLRSNGVDTSQLYALGYTPYSLIQYVLPSFRIYYPPVPQSLQNYLGLLTLFVLVAWFTGVSKRFTKITDKRYTLFVVTFVVCILLAIYKSPLAMLLHYVPLYSSFREAVRLMFIGDFALAMLLGFILNSIIVSKVNISEAFKKHSLILKRLLVYVLIPLAILVTAFKLFFLEKITTILQNFYVAKQFKNAEGGLPLEHYTTLIRTYVERDVNQLTLFSLNVVSLLAILALIYFLFKKAEKISISKFLTLSLLILVVDFSCVYFDRFPTVPKQELFKSGTTTQMILSREKDVNDFRYISVFGEAVLWRESVRCEFPDMNYWNISREVFELRRELIDSNFNIFSGIQSADGYEPFMVRHVSDVSGYIGSRLTLSSDAQNIMSIEKLDEKKTALIDRKNILRSQNVKYIVSPYEINDVDFTLVFKEEVGKCKTPVYIYELSHPYPRFFLTQNIVSEPQVDFKSTMEKINSSNEPVVVLHGTSSLSSASSNVVPIKGTYEGDSIFFDLPERSGNFYMNIGLTWMPGWHAKLDGVEAQVFRANYSTMSLFIPAGTRKIELYYEAVSYF
jgi:hypothetical protein